MDTSISSGESNAFDLWSFLEAHLRSSLHSWSIGIPGAIGEFMYDEDEQVEITADDSCLGVLTPRGAMLVKLMPGIKCVAFEDISACTRSWSQNVVFCIPECKAILEETNALTELGADQQAVSANSRNARLFDLGLGSPYLRFCVRSENENFIGILRENCGRSIFEQGNPVSAAVLEHSPTRVVISALGRVEIETRIPKSAAETVAGPHTHLLPALLNAHKKPLDQIPEGHIEVLSLYPEHPLFDKYGEPYAFRESAYLDFQKILLELGPEGYALEKNRAGTLSADANLDLTDPGASSLKSRAHRIAKMQAAYLQEL